MSHPFTETYIAMAKAAEEIQAMRTAPASWIFGDWSIIDVYGESDDGIATPMLQCLGGTAFDGLDFPIDSRPLVFIPRLDQLLGMLEGGPLAFADKAFSCDYSGYMLYGEAMQRDIPDSYNDTADWHELALAVVMLEKFGKKWNGKEWVKA